MSFSRRVFFNSSFNSLGALASLQPFSAAFAQNSTSDDDKDSLKTLTKPSGNFDIRVSENLSKEISWSYQNSKGALFSTKLASHGDSINHPKNPLLTWYFDEKDHFEQTDIYSQIDDKFAVMIKSNENDGFHSLAVVQCTADQI